jgi:putative ABC transport system permease protein
MSLFSFLGSLEIGLIFALVALGVFLSFRILAFPDLTVDGSFPLGGAVVGALILSGFNPLLATMAAMAAGSLAGLLTAWLNVRFNILHLLASILTMIALYSINLRIMGAPNLPLLNQTTVIDYFAWLDPAIQTTGLPVKATLKVASLATIVAIIWLLLARFLTSEFGLAMRATGANARMARAQGVSTNLHIYVGMALSNALVALAGALFAQTAGFADANGGAGTIVSGLAAVILGETLFRTRSILIMLFACVIGAIVYRIAIALALNSSGLGLKSSDINLVTAVLVGMALMLPNVRNPVKSLFRRSA